jgi:4,5-dihydroxyphthalate decarboxylase
MTSLQALLGDYPVTSALRRGEITSDRIRLEFADVTPPSKAFKRTVRELAFDVSELAIMTFLQARACGKPLVLLPAVVMQRPQYPFLVCNAARGRLGPRDLAGKRIGIRSYAVTTSVWLRGVLADDYGLDPASVRWVSFEEPHLAEYREPANAERAPQGATPVQMLLDGELDAAILADAKLPDERLARVFADPAAEDAAWRRRHGGAMMINHMVVVSERLCRNDPDAVREVWRLLAASRARAGLPAGGGDDPNPYGAAANRRNLEIAIDYAARQDLLARPLAVDDLYDEVTRELA